MAVRLMLETPCEHGYSGRHYAKSFKGFSYDLCEGAKSRIVVDPSSLPERAVEAAAKELFGTRDDATYNYMARAAIRGFLESLSEEEK